MTNTYAEGSLITARENPARKLIVSRYLDRIYYCKVVDDPAHKLLAYFERELIPPGKNSL